MSLSSTDLPSVIPLPEGVDLILEATKRQLESGADVVILDRRQRSMVVYSGKLQETEVTADSLPFLLSNHSVNVLPSMPTLEECVQSLCTKAGILCVFYNPSDAVTPLGVPSHPSKIINSGALLGLIEIDDKRILASITIGTEDGQD